MSTYEISKSSLLSLKVEILKKQEEINKSKLENKSFVPASSSYSKKGPKVVKNKGVEERGGKDYEEDPDLLRKSRQMLEAKSKLYDKLSNKTSNFEENKHYLVNFNEKSGKNSKSECPNFDDDPDDIDNYPTRGEYSPENRESYNDDDIDSEDEWTEYTDALGRTRTCLKKDLNYMKNKDQRIIGGDNRTVVDDESKKHAEKGAKSAKFDEKSELLSSDMKRELLRQQWEKEEAALANKDNVHYQNVLFDEARTHGVGYFAFSKDETERAKQQAELSKLRGETAQKQKEAQDLKKTRENLLKNRIRAAQNRKRARLGLPPIDSDDETNKCDDKEAIINVEAKELTQEEKERELKRQQHIRPWDIGKEGVEAPKEHYIYSQEEWITKKREERNKEFAPPKNNDKNQKKRSYSGNFSAKNKKTRANTINPYKTTNETSDSSDSSSSDDTPNNKQHKNAETTKISLKLTQITSPGSSFATVISSNETNSNNITSITPTAIINELLYSPTQSSDDSSSNDEPSAQNYRSGVVGAIKGKYAQIAPPSMFGDGGPGGGAKRGCVGAKSGDKMADSIMMGLRYLRERAEGKGKLNRGDDDMMG